MAAIPIATERSSVSHQFLTHLAHDEGGRDLPGWGLALDDELGSFRSFKRISCCELAMQNTVRLRRRFEEGSAGGLQEVSGV